MSDAEVRTNIKRDPDAKATDAAFWKSARLVLLESKRSMAVRRDAVACR